MSGFGGTPILGLPCESFCGSPNRSPVTGANQRLTVSKTRSAPRGLPAMLPRRSLGSLGALHLGVYTYIYIYNYCFKQEPRQEHLDIWGRVLPSIHVYIYIYMFGNFHFSGSFAELYLVLPSCALFGVVLKQSSKGSRQFWEFPQSRDTPICSLR